MMSEKRMRAGVVGAGAISDIYLKNMTERFDNLEVRAICAGHLDSAKKKAEKYGLKAVTLEEMLEDPEIDLVVNLTPPPAHYGVIKAALEHGKHVYTEKTMTDDPEKSMELAALAREKGLYLGCAPDTFLGAALVRARDFIDGGLLGEINSFSISANRNNEMLLSAYAYLRQPGAGIVSDYGVYYVTALVSLLGPVKRVGSMIRAPYPTHVNTMPGNPLQGQVMDTPNESEVSAVIQLESGVTGTFHINADSIFADQAFFYIYGTKGILVLPDPDLFCGQVKFIPQPEKFWEIQEPLPLWNFGPVGDNLRGIGPSDLAEAVLKGKACRPSKEMACHVHEVLAAMLSGGEKGAFTDIRSTCERPAPAEPCRVPVKKLAHLAFHVKDMDAMLRFYTEVLGMEKLFTLTFRDLYDSVEDSKKQLPAGEDPLLDQLRALGDRPWIEYLKLADGQFVELFHDVEGFNAGKTHLDNRWEHYGYVKMNYEVPDIQALRSRLEAAGAVPEDDVHETADGSLEMKIHDPEGNEIQFTQYCEAGKKLLQMEEQDPYSCSGLSWITQAAYQVKDERNMLSYYTKGLGLRHAARLTCGDLANFLEAGGCAGELLFELRRKASSPWIDYIEAAPHQYIELFYTGGQKKKDAPDLEHYYGYQHICLEVEDIHAAWDAVTKNGIQPDTQISLGCDHTWQFWVKDPDGNRMEFHAYTAASRQLQ